MTKKRSIFEEVGSEKALGVGDRTTGLIDRNVRDARRSLLIWLFALFVLVALLVVVGGLTRLTDSGLSITEWRPVTGALPPMTADDWEAEFLKYRETAEYRLQNRGMDLGEFKVIYWWEWGHRQLARVIGVVWASGFLFFLAARRIPIGWMGRLLSLGALGAVQAFIGWWMVSSGLTGTALDVASYRLAIHLGLAFAILGLIAWFLFDLSRPARELMQARRSRESSLGPYAAMLVVFVFVQILLGALVAGIDAGRNYTDWPYMGGWIFPPGMWEIQPWWRNLFENDGTIQFMHRLWSYLLAAFGIGAWFAARRSGRTHTRRMVGWTVAAIFGQIALGVVTVKFSAPWQMAILHQIAAMALWVTVLNLRHQVLYPIAQTVRES